MTQSLRNQILVALAEHQRSGEGNCRIDRDMATRLEASLIRIRMELHVLAAEGFVTLLQDEGLTVAARITPVGLKEAEQVVSAVWRRPREATRPELENTLDLFEWFSEAEEQSRHQAEARRRPLRP